jgi:hypothetical protein
VSAHQVDLDLAALTLKIVFVGHQRPAFQVDISALVQRIAWNTATSIRLPEHESEGHNEELIALIIADMQNPVTPILEAALFGEGLHDAVRMIPRFSKIIHDGSAAIDENLPGVRAVEIYVRHFDSFKCDGSPR